MSTPKVAVVAFDQEAFADDIHKLLEGDSDAEMRWNAFIAIQKKQEARANRRNSQSACSRRSIWSSIVPQAATQAATQAL